MEYHYIETTQQNFNQEGCKWLANQIAKSIKERGHCVFGLSGGSTPGPIYEELGNDK